MTLKVVSSARQPGNAVKGLARVIIRDRGLALNASLPKCWPYERHKKVVCETAANTCIPFGVDLSGAYILQLGCKNSLNEANSVTDRKETGEVDGYEVTPLAHIYSLIEK